MTTPLVRLAPLDLIRGFVAVGRRMSVTLAAEDLCLTQSAVSRQIHSLEDALGVSLFHRGYRSISFTPAGERLFRTADSVVRQLQDAFDTILRPAERRPVTITASIGLAASWLLPRLPELQRRYPTLDVRVAANDKILDLRTEDIDLAIRYASVAAAPSGATRLFDEAVQPVAQPSPTVSPFDADRRAPHASIECASGHAYWLVQADAAARQEVRDVAQWLAEQARTVTAAPAAGASLQAVQPHDAPAPARQQSTASERVALSQAG